MIAPGLGSPPTAAALAGAADGRAAAERLAARNGAAVVDVPHRRFRCDRLRGGGPDARHGPGSGHASWGHPTLISCRERRSRTLPLRAARSPRPYQAGRPTTVLQRGRGSARPTTGQRVDRFREDESRRCTGAITRPAHHSPGGGAPGGRAGPVVQRHGIELRPELLAHRSNPESVRRRPVAGPDGSSVSSAALICGRC